MSKEKKSEKKGPDSQDDLRETASRIWLAGLGAMAAAEEEGSKLFKKLVERGEEIESERKDKVRDGWDKAVEVAESAWEGVSTSFDDRMVAALHRLGVPTREEIQGLTAKVEELTKKIESLKPKATSKVTSKGS